MSPRENNRNVLFYHSIHEKKTTHFRAWKKGKTWLYLGMTLSLLVAGLNPIALPFIGTVGLIKAIAATSPIQGGQSLHPATYDTYDTGNHSYNMSDFQNGANYTLGGTARYTTTSGGSTTSSTPTGYLDMTTTTSQVGWASFNGSLDMTKPLALTVQLNYSTGYTNAGDALGLILTPATPATMSSNMPTATGGYLGIQGLANTYFLGRDLYSNLSDGNSQQDGQTANGWVSGSGSVMAIRRTDSYGKLEQAQYPLVGTNSSHSPYYDANGQAYNLAIESASSFSEATTVLWTPDGTNTAAAGYQSGTLQLSITLASGTTQYLSVAAQLPDSATLGFVGATGGYGSNLSVNVSSATASVTPQRGTEDVTVNYINSYTGKAISSNGWKPSTILANVGDTVTITAPGGSASSTPGVKGTYTYVAPLPTGYQYTNVNGTATGASLAITNTSVNTFNINYAPYVNNTATFNFTGSSSTVSAQTYSSVITDDAMPSTLSADLTAKVPAGYYISAIQSTNTDYNGAADPAITGGDTATTIANFLAAHPNEYNLLETSANAVYSGAYTYQVTLTPLTQTATFTYAWASNTPGTTGNAGSLIPFGNPATTSLPANTTATGGTDTPIANPGPNLPTWSDPASASAHPFTSAVLGSSIGWQMSNPVTGAPLASYSGSPYEVATSAINQAGVTTTALKTTSGSGQSFDSSGNSSNVTMPGSPLDYYLSNSTTNTYHVGGNSFTTVLIPNNTSVIWTTVAVDSSGQPLTDDPNFGEAGNPTRGYFANQGSAASGLLAGSPLTDQTAAQLGELQATPADLTNVNGSGKTYYLTGGYSYTDDTVSTQTTDKGYNTLTHYASWSDLLAAHPNVTSSDPVIAMEVALDQTQLTSKAEDEITVGTTYNPISDLTAGLDRDGTNADNAFSTVNGPVQVKITDSSGNVIDAANVSSKTGTYTVTYTALNGAGYTAYQNWLLTHADGSVSDYLATLSADENADQTVSSTTLLTVTDDTALSSNSQHTISKILDYQPESDLISAFDADGQDNDSNKNTVNGNVVLVSITDKNNQTVWQGLSTDTIPANTLSAGTYTEHYTALTGTGQLAYQNWLTTHADSSVSEYLTTLTSDERAANTVSTITQLEVIYFELPHAGGIGLITLLALATLSGFLSLSGLAWRSRKEDQ